MVLLRPGLDSYSRAAHLLHLTGDLPGAIRLMEMAIGSGGPYQEHTAWCQAQLARLRLEAGDHAGAVAAIDAARAGAPHNYHVLVATGRVRAAHGDVDGAIAAYRQATAILALPEPTAALADLYRRRGDTAAAAEHDALATAVRAGAHGGENHAHHH